MNKKDLPNTDELEKTIKGLLTYMQNQSIDPLTGSLAMMHAGVTGLSLLDLPKDIILKIAEIGYINGEEKKKAKAKFYVNKVLSRMEEN
jgi:hypothetical protein